MNFVVYFSLEGFFKAALEAEATAHLVAFSLPSKAEGSSGYVLITTDKGVEGGTVHALKITLSDKAGDSAKALEFAGEAFVLIAGFLKKKGMKLREGILSTAGLHESLLYWGQVVDYSVAELKESLEKAKKKETE
jgi:hypothetical protein